MRREYTFSLLIAALVICGACSNVRQAPVEDRQEASAAPEPPADPVTAPPTGEPLREEGDGQWEELPGSVESAITAAPAEAGTETGHYSDNPAVLALLDDTDLSISQGDPEAAAVSVERALRLEPKNPWLWHRLAVLKLEQGHRRLAVALAQKSNSLAARHPALRRANADLIKRAEKH